MKRSLKSTVASLAISVLAFGAAGASLTVVTAEPALAVPSHAKGGTRGNSGSAPGHGGSSEQASAGRSGAQGGNRNPNGNGPSSDGFPQVSLQGLKGFVTGRGKADKAPAAPTETTSATTTRGPAPHSAAAARLAPESSVVPVEKPRNPRAELGPGNSANANIRAMMVSQGRPKLAAVYAEKIYAQQFALEEIESLQQANVLLQGDAVDAASSTSLTDEQRAALIETITTAESDGVDVQAAINTTLADTSLFPDPVTVTYATYQSSLSPDVETNQVRIGQLEAYDFQTEIDTALEDLVSPKPATLSDEAIALLNSFLPGRDEFGFTAEDLLPPAP